MGQIFSCRGLAKVIAPQYLKLEGLWRRPDDVEYFKLELVGWFENRRFLEPIDHLPPAEFEQAYYKQLICQVHAA